jgi:FMN phosphatase YigB (HAD superfamily)
MTPTPVSFKNIPTIHEIKNGYPSVRALFFDMDGTIFNTEFIHAEALLKMALKYQIKIPFDPQVERYHQYYAADTFLPTMHPETYLT